MSALNKLFRGRTKAAPQGGVLDGILAANAEVTKANTTNTILYMLMLPQFLRIFTPLFFLFFPFACCLAGAFEVGSTMIAANGAYFLRSSDYHSIRRITPVIVLYGREKKEKGENCGKDCMSHDRKLNLNFTATSLCVCIYLLVDGKTRLRRGGGI